MQFENDAREHAKFARSFAYATHAHATLASDVTEHGGPDGPFVISRCFPHHTVICTLVYIDERKKNPLNDRRNTSNIRAREMVDVKLLRIT